MKKISLKGLLGVLSEKEMKNVMGGSGGSGAGDDCNRYPSCGPQCEGKQIGEWCDGGLGICKCWPDPLRYVYCKICYH